jgi:hypothetical protein
MKRKHLRIAIDLDDTVFNWGDAHEAYYKCKLNELSDSQITEQVNKLRLNKQFWTNLELLERPDFVYELIATKRVLCSCCDCTVWLNGYGWHNDDNRHILALLISLSYTLLVWTIYSHWMYDKFINDRVEGAQKNRGIYVKVKEDDSEALARHGEMMTTRVRCSLNSRPIKPITDDELTIAELPTSFNRSDIARLAESKKVLYEDNERYIEEHKDDEIYKVEEQPQEQTKEDKKREKRIEKAKKELAKRNKK